MHLPPWLALTSPPQGDASPQAPGSGGPAAPPTGGGSTTAPDKPASPSPAPGGDLWGTVILFGGMFVLLWFFLLGPERRKRKAHEARLAQLKEKDEVMTLGGIFGTIAMLRGDQVVLRVDEKRGTTLRVARSSIASILPRESGAAAKEKGEEEGDA